MKIAYFDCFAGISGDMTLGALLDLGVDESAFRQELAKLGDLEYTLDIRKADKDGVEATDVHVLIAESHHHRHLKHIREIIRSGSLSPGIQERALRVFQLLAEAEGTVHGHSPEHVHFHEVGAVDAIVDIVGASILIEMLGIERVVASPLPVGHGFVQAAHGRIPLPAPATVEILKGVPVYDAGVEGELVTPTGAAIIRAIADSFGQMPPMTISRVGYGAGKTEFSFPNLLRVMLGETADAGKPPARTSVIETNIDDMNPEFYEFVMEKLFAAGALDVFLTPIQMKKGRPATLLTAVCPTDVTDEVARTLLAETTSFGVRITTAERRCMDRRWETVSTPYGEIRMKIGTAPGVPETASPEYEDVRQAAEARGVPIRWVYASAVAKYQQNEGSTE